MFDLSLAMSRLQRDIEVTRLQSRSEEATRTIAGMRSSAGLNPIEHRRMMALVRIPGNTRSLLRMGREERTSETRTTWTLTRAHTTVATPEIQIVHVRRMNGNIETGAPY